MNTLKQRSHKYNTTKIVLACHSQKQIKFHFFIQIKNMFQASFIKNKKMCNYLKTWLHGSQCHSPDATKPTLVLVHLQANATIPTAPSQCICPNNAFMMMLFCC